MVSDDVQSVVDSVIREQLYGIDIREVETERDEGYYGEDVLRVTVTVNSPAADFDGDKLSGLVRHLRPRLEHVHEDAFPMVRYRSINDPR